MRNIFKSVRSKLTAIHERNIRERAEMLYQVSEHNGELWLTYNGVPVVPSHMLTNDILDTLRTLRISYISYMLTKEKN